MLHLKGRTDGRTHRPLRFLASAFKPAAAGAAAKKITENDAKNTQNKGILPEARTCDLRRQPWPIWCTRTRCTNASGLKIGGTNQQSTVTRPHVYVVCMDVRATKRGGGYPSPPSPPSNPHPRQKFMRYPSTTYFCPKILQICSQIVHFWQYPQNEVCTA